MSKLTVAQRMRKVAGCFYFALAVYQMFLSLYVMRYVVVYNARFVWIYAHLLVVAAGVMAVWMFSSNKVFSPGIGTAVAVGTALVVIYELFTYREQTESVINNTLYILFNGALYGNRYVLYVLMIIRLMLMILAAFFVTNCKKSLDYMADKSKTDNVKLKVTDEEGKAPDAATVDIEKK